MILEPMTEPMLSKKPRYIIGIDLGTSNCALSYLDTFAEQPCIEVLDIEQWEDENSKLSQALLPSFLYLKNKAERKRESFPFLKNSLYAPPDSLTRINDIVVGRLASNLSATHPARVIHSAKSWLCHGGVNRSEPILPWHSDEIIGSDRLTPAQVSAYYLAYLAKSWQEQVGGQSAHFCDQTIIVTVPASFDDAAQKLTLEAAEIAGYPKSVRLMEEPQAAFFDWYLHATILKDNSSELNKLSFFSERKRVLVCDIGGGTSDFSIIETNGAFPPKLKRTKVSKHILCGGDNIDLAISHLVEQRRKDRSQPLNSTAWVKLTAACRKLKEKILSDQNLTHIDADTSYHIAIEAKTSTSLFDSSETVSITHGELIGLILDGFFPQCGPADKPREDASFGLTEWNLPYAQDTRITRHLANFLDGESIDYLVFAGGTLTPSFLQSRLIEMISSWQDKAVTSLKIEDGSLAIAKGATAFGHVKQSAPEQLEETYPKAVFLEVDHAGKKDLVKLMDKHARLGSVSTLDQDHFKLLVNQRVEFSLYTALTEPIKLETGSLLTDKIKWQLSPLPPLTTIIKCEDKTIDTIEVMIQAEITMTGLLSLRCVSKLDPSTSWQLEFNLRDFRFLAKDATHPTNQSALSFEVEDKEKANLNQAIELITQCFGKRKGPAQPLQPNALNTKLEALLGPRQDWSIGTLRKLWQPLKIGMNRRSRSLEHESAWLNLTGFALRPGFGLQSDHERVRELWSCFKTGASHPKDAKALDQWWIMWRRVAGGLSREEQDQIFDKIFPNIKREKDHNSREQLLLAGSLERATMQKKLQLGNTLVTQILSGQKQLLDAKIWALTRLVSRIPIHSGPEVIIRPSFVEAWLNQLLSLDMRSKHYGKLANTLLQGARIVNNRDFDIDPSLRDEIALKLKQSGFNEDQLAAIQSFQAPDQNTYAELFGEALPSGIIMTYD